MKIKKIEETNSLVNTYAVTFEPNWLEKLFGVKEKRVEYKDNNSSYAYGGQRVYVDKEGNKLPNGSSIGLAIDKWRRRW